MADVYHKGSLPEGWIVKVSKNYPDRVYYFNVITGCSTWECPELHSSETNVNKQSRSLNVFNTPALNKHAEFQSEVKSPNHLLPQSKILEFLSDAKRECQKRSGENETPSRPKFHSKPSTPPTAIVAPLIDNNPIKKKKKKKSKNNPLALSDTPSATILQRNGSDDATKKVSFTIKSKEKIHTSRSEREILAPKSKNFPPVFKKKPLPSVSVPSTTKTGGNSADQGIRYVTIDKNRSSPSNVNVKNKEQLKRSPSLDSSSHCKNNKQTGLKAEKQCNWSSQDQLGVGTKRKSDTLNINSDGDLRTSISKSVRESDSEVSDMDCEMNPDFEELTITVTSADVNFGASTSKNTDQDLFDIEMLDVSSSDLVKIDDIFISGFQGSLLENYFIVVDTNIFISELKVIDELKDTPVNGSGPPHFIIPWVVFQELDNLKRNGGKPKMGVAKETSNKKAYDVKKSAGEAIRYLNILLKAKHPRFHFQRPDEAQYCRKDFSKNNDDQLLECCMKLLERLPKENVILFTNDRNLENKSMVLNILVRDKNSIVDFLKPNITSPQKCVTNITYVPEPFKVLDEQKSLEQIHQANYKKSELEIHTHLSVTMQILKDVLDPLFEKEMDEAYGDAWHFFKVERHVLSGILKGMLRYWRTVFTFFFSVADKAKFELLQEKCSRPEGFLGERAECLEIFEVIDELFVVIKRKWPTIHVPILQLRNVKALTEKAFSKLGECEKCLNNVENAIKDAEMSCCIEVFNHNWTVINHLCGCTADFCSLPHKLLYDKTAPIPPKSEFLRIMPNLFHSLGQLKDIMEKMLHTVKTSIPHGTVFKELHKMLMDLVPSLRIQTENISSKYFSAKLVERFCRLPENRSRIEEGYKQLVNFYDCLEKSLRVLLTETV